MTNLAPLAERMRPTQIDDIYGQEHLTGKKGLLRKSIELGSIPSILLWGPPGVGKTTLAQIIAETSVYHFYNLSAIQAGVKEVREVIEKAKFQPKTILFIDEIHRFNKGQQDALLGAVEKGIVTLIGATTENPSFELNSALLSRCQVYILKTLTEKDLLAILENAISKDPFLQTQTIKLFETSALFQFAGGDARKLLNIFDLFVQNQQADSEIILTNELLQQVVQQKMSQFDKSGEMHYDIASAFIKSIRGSDPNAAVYWLARMIEGGEDLKFIARRLLILASEDVGNANPTAFVMAHSCFQAVNVIGYPESEIILSQTVVYLASSPKSNSSYLAIKKARQIAKEKGDLSVPLHLRNAPTQLMKNLGYGSQYTYPHDFPNHFISQEYMPKELEGYDFFQPQANARENEMKRYLIECWKGKYGYR